MDSILEPSTCSGSSNFVRVPLGSLFAHHVTFDAAVEAIVSRARTGLGGYVVTPNVDHVCVAEHNEGFRTAHRAAFLSVVDGTPLMWLARADGQPLPARIAGSDLIVPISTRARTEGLTVGLFGASEAASLKAQDKLLKTIPGLTIVCRVCPRFDPTGNDLDAVDQTRLSIEAVRSARPDILFVAMGTPNQELFMHRYAAELSPSVLCGIGAGLDFVAGDRVRAPQLFQRLGLEWFFRLLQEPSRMWRRYLVRDWAIFGIAYRQIRNSRSGGKGEA